ncbi:MAG: protein kinase [Planctomycetes bacterium]|nr:protein kinase [Planctomycetota bacterium]
MKRQAEFPPAVLNALLRFLADGMDESGAPPPLEACLARFPGYAELVEETHQLFRASEIKPTGAPEPEASAPAAELEPELVAAEALASSIFATGAKHELVPGALLGPYRLERELGRGAQGWVWLALDTQLGRRVALKTFHGGSLADPAALQRFEREARIVSRLEHPGICGLYEAGTLEGIPFIAVRYIEGRTLASALIGGSGDRAWQRLWAQRIAQMARALHAAHEVGVVHRDVKPGNAILDADDRPVLLDFGLAQAQLEPGLTLEGSLFGTPPYMAPEQCRGELALDRRVDVYALGVILHQALAGTAPFAAATPRSMIEATLHEEAPDLSQVRPRVPRDLALIARTAMARDAADRYATASALADDLERWLRGEPIAARPIGPCARLLRWARRRPALALALFAFLASSSIGTAVSLRALQHAQRAADERSIALDAERAARRASETSLVERDRALRSEQSLRLAAESRNQSRFDPNAALELALRARELGANSAVEASLALQEALNAWRELKHAAVSTQGIIDLLFLSGEELLCLDAEGLLRRWAWRSEAPQIVEGPPLRAIAAHHTRAWLAAGTADGRLRWLDARFELVREQVLAEDVGLAALAFDPAGERLFALTERRLVICVQCADGALLWTKKLRARSGAAVAVPRFAPRVEGRSALRPRLACSPGGELVVVSDAHSGSTCLRVSDGEERAYDSAPRAVALSGNEYFAAQGSATFHVGALDIEGPQRSLPRSRVDRPVTDLALSRTTLAIGSQSGYVELWHRESLSPYAGLRVAEVPVRRLAVDELGSALAVGSDDGLVHVYVLGPDGARLELPLERIPRTAQVEPCAFLADGSALWYLAPMQRAVLHDPSGALAPRVIADPSFAGAVALAVASDARHLALLYSSSEGPRARQARAARNAMRLRIYEVASGIVLSERELAHDATELLPREQGGWILASPELVEHCDALGAVERAWRRASSRNGPRFLLGELLRADASGRRLFALAPRLRMDELRLPEGSEQVEVEELQGTRQHSWIHSASGTSLLIEGQVLQERNGDGGKRPLLELEAEEEVIECAWLTARSYLVWSQLAEEGESSRLRCFELPARELWSTPLERVTDASRMRGSHLLTIPRAGGTSDVKPPLVVRAPSYLETHDAHTGELLWRLPFPDDARSERVELDPSGTWIWIADRRTQRLRLLAVDPERLARRWLARVGR